MSFRVQERAQDGATEWIAEWPFRARAQFIRSNAYETLHREILRYVRGEVTGRSFLIAGHRGAGKTALIRQVIEDLRRDRIAAAVDAARVTEGDSVRMLDRHRPLAIRLHGPSLLPPGRPGLHLDEPATAASDPSVITLEQITIALYRALAAEFAESFTNHARERSRLTEGADRPTSELELAGQFMLELDNVPRPATLRAFYDRIDRLREGVLWPLETSALLGGARGGEQGFREIVALATAAQAFELCAGVVTSTETAKDTRTREAGTELKLDAGVKDLSKAIFGLGLGGLAALSAGPEASAAVGLVTALLGTLAFGWSGRRTAKAERSRDYTFIRDRTKQTLERDLPLVIDRIREAGLAPVFVLDELDKLDDARSCVARLINSLKHLTTDYGCFCFLTDRPYYEQVTVTVETQAFPVEHSFFSHRFFILHQPPELLRFLLDTIRPEGPAPSLEGRTEGAESIETRAGRLSLALFVLHRSKLNVIDMLREIATLCEANGHLRPTIDKLRSDREYLLPAKVQLAIGILLNEDLMRRRVERDPQFMQAAVDALYLLSRTWESGSPTVTLDREALVEHLLGRIGAAGGERALHANGTTPVDLDILASVVRDLGRLLSDPSAFKRRVEGASDPRDPEGERALHQILPPEPLLRRSSAPEHSGREVYEFLFDIYGHDRQTLEALKSAPYAGESSGAEPSVRVAPTSSELPPDLVDQLKAALTFLDEFDVLLADLRLVLGELVSLGALPTTIVPAELEAARRRLDLATRGGAIEPVSKDLPMAQSAAGAIRDRAATLDRLFRIAILVGRDAAADLPAGLRAVARFVDLAAVCSEHATGEAPSTTSDSLRIRDLPESAQEPASVGRPDDDAAVRSWRTILQSWREGLPAFEPGPATPDAWSSWAERLRDYFVAGVPTIRFASYSDLVSAAQARLPGSVFQYDLQRITIVTWSDLCLRSFPRPDAVPPAEAPAWMFPVALRALGFSRQVLEAALDIAGTTMPDGLRRGDLIETAPTVTPPGAFLLMRDRNRSVASAAPQGGSDQRAGAPIIALSENPDAAYTPALSWLRTNASITRIVHELEDSELA